MSKIIGRRSLLRGIAAGLTASIALPPILEMFDGNGTAYADGTAIARPFGMWFWGNGVRLDRWTPKTTGTGWAVTEELQPFADAGVKDYLSVVSGTRVVPAPGVTLTGHHGGKVTMLAGSAKDGPYYGVDSPLVHEIVAQQWTGQTRFSKLEMGVSQTGFETYPVEPFGETSPQKLFDTVFSMNLPKNVSGAQAQAARTAMMEALLKDGNALLPKLGTESRQQLGATLDAWNALGKRIATAPPTCAGLPTRPNAPAYSRNHEELEAISQAMADVLTVALACDLTRSFFFRFSAMQSDTVFWQVGSGEGLHTQTHDGGAQEQVHKAITFGMKQFAYLCKKLKAIPVGAGNLLDQVCIMGATEHDQGDIHTTNDMPVLVVGRAGGKLRGGVHYRSTTGENATKTHLTCLRAVGVPAASFGKNGNYLLGMSTQTLGALEV
jgi:hypothetical protein